MSSATHQRRRAVALREFRMALQRWQQWIQADPLNWTALGLGPRMLQQDLVLLKIEKGRDHPGRLFDHRLEERRLDLFDPLLDAYGTFWSKRRLDSKTRRLMAELFLLHEWKHVPQGVASATYQIDGASTSDFFARLDYAADAFALERCYRRYADPLQTIDTALLGWLLEAQFLGGCVFASLESLAEGSAHAQVEGSRIRRQLVWGLQLARSRSFPHERGYAAFRLDRALDVQLHPIGRDGHGADLCDLPFVSRESLVTPLALVVLAGIDERIHHTITILQESTALARLLFDADLRGADDAFRSLFAVNERLVGRGAGSFEPPNEIGQEIQKTIEAVKEVGEKVDSTQKKEIRAKLNLAQTLSRQEKRSEGIRELEAALALAQAAKLVEEEVEVLLALALLSSSRRGIGNRRGYLDQAEKKIGEISVASVRALYFRARAAACSDERNRHGAEAALRLALQCCENADGDKDKNIETQAFAVRSELIILLCELDRHNEAAGLVAACDSRARSHAGDEDGELMQAAMSAGILWALKTGNEEEAIRRIHELEATAKTAHQAGRIGGQLSNMANNSSHMSFHKVALAAAEAAVRLGAKAGDKGGFLVGALYTVAVVTFQSGDHATAKRKAEALLDACNDPKDAVIKQAANHLLAEIARGAGDAESAVALASKALASASGRPEEVAFTKQAVARALSDNGQTEEALAHAIQAYELMKTGGVPTHALADVLLQVVNYSSVLGWSAEASNALTAISMLEPHPHDGAKAQESIAEVQVKAPKLAEMNIKLRDRIVEATVGGWAGDVKQPQEVSSLSEANAKVMKSLLAFWDAIPSAYPDSAAVAYDFWGRGNFVRILRNSQTIPRAFNITIEVRTLEGLKQAIRLWTLYADLLLLIWKGPTRDGRGLDALPECDEMFNGPGGSGYILGSPVNDESGRQVWLCLTHASVLPVEVVSFLMNEARPLLATGRLVVVPAIGVGCMHPGHGPLEQLLTESANAVAGLRGSGKSNEIPIGLLPYSPDAPFALLADIAQAQQGDLRKLRRLLVRRTRELAPDESGIVANKELAMEIDDVLRDLADQQSATARKRGESSANEPLNGSFCRFHRDGSRLLPCSAPSPSPFAPLLTLQNFGYKWGVGSPGSQPQGRYEPGKESVVGPWLALPTERWSILAVQAEE